MDKTMANRGEAMSDKDYTGLEFNEDYIFEQADSFAFDAAPVFDEEDHRDIRPRLDPRKTPLKIAGVACASIAFCCVALFLYTLVIGPAVAHGIVGSTEDEESLSDNRAAIQLPVYVPSLDAQGSRIPVGVSGELADGTSYEKDLYLSFDGSGIKLEPGSYTLHVQESPISSGGILYSIPDGSIDIEVGEDGNVSYDTSVSLIFAERDALSVTDAQIDAAKKYIQKDPERTQYAGELAQRARQRREDAKREIEEKAAQEAAAREAAEKQRQAQEQQQRELENQQNQQYQQNTNGSSESNYSEYEYDTNQNQGYDNTSDQYDNSSSYDNTGGMSNDTSGSSSTPIDSVTPSPTDTSDQGGIMPVADAQVTSQATSASQDLA